MKNKFKKGLSKKKIGILGAAFKSDIDDTRDSLSIDLYHFLKKKGLKVNISDEYVIMDEIIPKNQLIKKSDIIILGAPHTSYKKIKIPKNKYLIDSWGFFEK
jgi:UDP-N-acetyl-D-mannosaminuronic acid dehydrogenase